LTVSDLFSSPLRVQLDGLPALIQVVLSNEPNLALRIKKHFLNAIPRVHVMEQFYFH
jgi:hypothetical protein